MIKVHCPSCSASYDVDEHRLPAGGLKMRCPKCDESFNVQPDGSTRSADTASSKPRPKKRKMTQVGLGPGPKLPPPAPAASRTAVGTAESFPAEELDLPAPMSSSLEDLPAPKQGGEGLDLDPFENLPDAVDLPAPRERSAEPTGSGFDPFADMDLPAPMESAGSADLPAPMDEGSVDLPAPRGGGADLPKPKDGSFADEVDLPMALTDAELPAPMALESDLPTAVGEEDLPAVRDDFSEPPERRHGGGPIELDLPDGDDLSLDMDVDPGVARPAPPPVPGLGAASPEPSAADRVSRDSAELDLPASDDLEFSELPSSADEVEHMPHPGTEGAAPPARKRKVEIRAALSRKPPPWLKKAVAALAALSLIVGGGFYMGSTKYGLFGVHAIEPFLPGSGDVVEVTQTIQNAEARAAADTYAATVQALSQLEQARSEARLNRALIARSLLHESFFQVRYGHDPQSAARADELRTHLQRRGDEAPGIHLALAANALRQGDAETAAVEIGRARNEDPADPYVAHVAGEIGLATGDGKAALEAFTRAAQADGSARAQWGLARAHRLLGDREATIAAAKKTLELSPDHAGARVAVAAQLIADEELDEAHDLLQVPAGLASGSDGATTPVARADRSEALSLVAKIEEGRGRRGAAREMYEKAVELDASNSRAALGAARLVLLEGGYADALARFQTVIGAEAQPGAEVDVAGQPRVKLEAKLGAAEALIALGKASEAQALLADLDTEKPVHAGVELWLGKVADALGDSRGAVRHLRNAIELEPTAFPAYMALAQHYKATKRPAEAVAVLVEAQDNIEMTAEVRRLLGDAEIARGRIDEGIAQYQKALEMEPLDSSAQFGLGVAYRRKLDLEAAAAALSEVEKLDANYPGLALERGRLAEAAGDFEGAVASYRTALEATPDDAALQSRLGAVLTVTGKLEEGEAILRSVLQEHPYSAEAEHYLGRIERERGDLVASRQHFVQASRLEPQNGMYRLYVAWAALDANEMTTALRELNEALKLDPTLGDAYWLRARIRIRAGQVRDALADLEKAIEYNPSRVEAYAAIGEAHYQLGHMDQAIAALQRALEADPARGYWWYRLGRLQLDVGKREAALESLAKGAENGAEMESPEPWLADAHRLMGDVYYAKRNQREAVAHYGRYLELAPPDAIDRTDVQAKLRAIASAR